jgi:uncharacterized protein involved in outer membrane biogenesis
MKLIAFLKKLLGYLSLLLLVILIAAGILAYLKQETILEEVKKELKLSVRSDLGFNSAKIKFFKTIPNLSLELIQFYIKNQSSFQFDQLVRNDTLLAAEAMYFELDMFELFKGNVRVNAIRIENAKLNLLENQSGISNYTFLSDSDTSDNSQTGTIKLESIVLKNAWVAYESLPSQISLSGILDDLALYGQTDSVSTQFDAKGKIQIQSVYSNSELFFRQFQGEITLAYIQDQQQVRIPSYRLSTSGIDLSGNLNYLFDSEDLSVNFQLNDNDAEELFNVSPFLASMLPDSIELKGRMHASGNYLLNFKKDLFGHYELDASLQKGIINFLSDSIQLTQVEVQAKMHNDSTDNLIISELKFSNQFPKGGNSQFSGKLVLSNKLDVLGDLTINLEPLQIAEWTGLKEIEAWEGGLRGRFALRGIQLDLADDNLQLIRELRPQGSIELNPIKYKTENYQVESNEIRVELMDESLRFLPFYITLNEQKIRLDSLHLDQIFKLISHNELRIDAGISTPFLDLLKLFPPTSPDTDESKQTISPSYKVKGSITLRADEISHDRFKARQVEGQISLLNEKILLQGIRMKTLNGMIALDASIAIHEDKKNRVNLTASLEEIDLHELLFSFRNFNQNYLTHKELIGDLSGNLKLTADLDSGLSIDYPTLEAQVRFSVKNGEITDLQSLRKMADFTRMEELQQIQFKAIEGTADLDHGKLIVYPSFIQSSVADLNFFGEHQLGNEMDYRFEILFSPSISKKRTDHLESTQEAGRTRIYLKLSGTEKDYSVSYDLGARKDAALERMKEERQILRDAFKQEFGRKEERQIETTRDNENQNIKKKAKVIWE